jgi:hypothetical protein
VTRLLIVGLVLLAGCDHGLEPPESSGPGAISGTVLYTGRWPSPDSVQDLRFVAMRFVPQDTSDFLQLTRMAISTGLLYGVESDTFLIENVDPGNFVYSGIAQQFDANILSWRPLGLVDGDGGLFSVATGETTLVHVDVDFSMPPLFPPESP